MSQVAINWIRQNAVQPMIPLIGARTVDQLIDNLAALEWELDEKQMAAIDAASPIDLGFPHSILPGNQHIFGKTFELIDRSP
jgi:diketogulonate reductase-like aldo/keto reductase